ncbi:MAG: MFS transporter [Candidatus Brocadiia bacterium]
MPQEPASPPPSLDRPLPVFSWALYDFANTIYSAIVVTAFFPTFMRRLAGRDIYTGLTQTLSMVLAGLVVPVAGAWADRTGKTKSYLWWLTLACCAATVCIGLVGDDALYDSERGASAPARVLVPVLVFFGLANVAYQSSLVFYNTLLPSVASPKRQGRVSGLGVGLGYLGVAVALPVAFLVEHVTGVMRSAFFVAGVLFLVSALPLFFFVHPHRPRRRVGFGLRAIREQYRQLGATLRRIAGLPAVLCFFVGNFLCVDVVNTLIMWTRPYLERGAGFSASGAKWSLFAMSVSAFPLGLGMGWLTDRMGPKRTMLAAATSLLLCIVVAGLSASPYVLVPVIVVFGSGGLAGMWVAGRKFLLEVAPPERVGEFFGLYGVTIKLSVLGCTVFAGLADWVGYRPALLSLLVPLGVGLAFLGAARPQRAESSNEEEPQ